MLKRDKLMHIIDNIKNTEIKNSEIHNKGLFATKIIDAGTTLCILSGQKILKEDYLKLLKSNNYSQSNFMEKYNLNENEIAVMPFRTKYSFINHSKYSNIESKVVDEKLYVYALFDIKKGEEILDTYNLEKHLDLLGGFKQ